MNQPDFAPGTHENTGEISMSSRECINPKCDALRDGLKNFCSESCEMEWINDRLSIALNKIAELEASGDEMLQALRYARGFLPIGGTTAGIALRAIDHAEKLQRGS